MGLGWRVAWPEPLGTRASLLVAMGFLMLALVAALVLTTQQPRTASERKTPEDPLPVDEHERIGGSAWEGVRAVFHSRYLAGIAAYVLILAIMATFIDFTRLHMVAAMEDGTDQRTTPFAWIDLITQLATLAMQALVAGHVMKRLGVAMTLTLLPLTAVLGLHRTCDRGFFCGPGGAGGQLQGRSTCINAPRAGNPVHRCQPRGKVQSQGVHRYLCVSGR